MNTELLFLRPEHGKCRWKLLEEQPPIKGTPPHSILTSFCNKISTASGTWKDKIEFLTAPCEDIVPAANGQTPSAIIDLNDYNRNVFSFTDLELLDGNFHIINTSAALDYTELVHGCGPGGWS
jgi:hypothetical protein